MQNFSREKVWKSVRNYMEIIENISKFVKKKKKISKISLRDLFPFFNGVHGWTKIMVNKQGTDKCIPNCHIGQLILVSFYKYHIQRHQSGTFQNSLRNRKTIQVSKNDNNHPICSFALTCIRVHNFDTLEKQGMANIIRNEIDRKLEWEFQAIIFNRND